MAIKITFQMIEREAINLGRRGYDCKVTAKVTYYLLSNAKILLTVNCVNKSNEIEIESHQLEWSLDDLAEYVLLPCVISVLPDDIKFLQYECS